MAIRNDAQKWTLNKKVLNIYKTFKRYALSAQEVRYSQCKAVAPAPATTESFRYLL